MLSRHSSMHQQKCPWRLRVSKRQLIVTILIVFAAQTAGIHHMKRDPIAWVRQRDDSVPLVVSNQCPETIYPGILTQSGSDPGTGGFKLSTGETKNLTVGSDWQGRVWGRTNCSFNSDGSGPSNTGGNNGGGSACGSGDCGGVVNCKLAVCPLPLDALLDQDD